MKEEPFRESITLGKFRECHNNKNDASTKGLLRTRKYTLTNGKLK